MPRYFFNIHRDGSTRADRTGLELADGKAATEHAEQIVRDFVENNVIKAADGSPGWVEALDEDHRPVVRLPLNEVAAERSASSRSG